MTPLITFASGAGDGEDYATAKYASLADFGIPTYYLRILTVYDRAWEIHAVAAVRFEQSWMILDNRIPDIRDAAKSTNLNPLFILGDARVRRVDAGQQSLPTDAANLVEEQIGRFLCPTCGNRRLSDLASLPRRSEVAFCRRKQPSC